MKGETKVTVCYGPLSWFEEQLGKEPRTYLLDAVNQRDEARRRIRHSIDGQERLDEEVSPPRPKHLVAQPT
jgi:ATP-dependent Clp protease ATP-binding subunit ClpA